METAANPLAPFLAAQECVILDGGLATALEANGHNLADSLWSARLLRDDPGAIRQVHLDYLRAGADIITTASYQASLPGFLAQGLTEDQAADLLRLSTRLAVEAREILLKEHPDRLRPLVAASVGPYGAYLADGSEYRGGYGVSPSDLRAFHSPRWDILTAGGVDLLACETLPALDEALVLTDLLAATPQARAWLSFSCRDGAHLCDGTPLKQALDTLPVLPNLLAVGINCTAPEHVGSLLNIMGDSGKFPALVYPNLGAGYDPDAKQWTTGPSTEAWLKSAPAWVAAGAVGVGGCCQVGPGTIAHLRQTLLN